MLQISQARKTFFAGTINEKPALRSISLTLAAGEFATIIGSNGAGKSTLLNSIAGTLPLDSGTVTIDGTVVNRMNDSKRAKFIGRVFQDPSAGTAPTLTIEENLAIALRRGTRRGLGKGVTNARRDLFRTELASLELGLESRLTAKVGLLSGGQRQALSLLMATFTQPSILLLDEHTAALDPQRADLVTRLTESVVKQHSLTTLMVTHNMEQALRVGNRLLMMHDGRIILDLNAAQKARTSVADLLGQFEKIKGASLDDRTLLA